MPLEAEGPGTTARRFVARLWPEGTYEQVERLFSGGKVTVDGVRFLSPDRSPEAGALVEVELEEPGEEVFGLPEAEGLLYGEEWVILEKPVGIPGRLRGDDPMDPIRFMADLLGLDREGFTPVWEMATSAGGPWIMAKNPEAAKELGSSIVRGEIQTTWIAQVLRPEFARGQWKSERGSVEYAVVRAEGALAEVQLTPKWGEEAAKNPGRLYFDLLKMLAEAGFSALGDGYHGGYLVEGGLRLRLGAIFGTEEFAHSWPAPRDWWPEEPVIALPEKEEEVEEDQEEGEEGRRPVVRSQGRRFRVGQLELSTRALEKVQRSGHPWILGEEGLEVARNLKPGDPVELVTARGASGIYALLDKTDDIIARRWSDDEESAIFRDEEIEIRLDEAISSRAEFFRELGRTDAFRIVHGEADALPGVWVDRLGPIFRVTTLGVLARGYRDWIYELLRRRDPAAMILEVEHTRDLRRQDGLPQARIVHEGARFLAPGDDLIVREEGLRYRVEPWEGVDVGLFPDQRDNRRQAAALAGPGQRWLNLFCHTGAFSVALARAGAHTTNVDLSRRYLRWLDENFALNGLDLQQRWNADEDARRFLRRTKHIYDGIIVDPPTAASSDAGFWSIRNDYEDLLTRCFEVLAPDGTILVCRNEKRPQTSLKDLVNRAAKRANRQLKSLAEAGPAADYPRLKGFPEGDKFEGLWVR